MPKPGEMETVVHGTRSLTDGEGLEPVQSRTVGGVSGGLGGAPVPKPSVDKKAANAQKAAADKVKKLITDKPSAFSQCSQQALSTIENRMSAGSALQFWLSYGTILSAAVDPVAAAGTGIDLDGAVEAMGNVSTIVKNRVVNDIDLMLLGPCHQTLSSAETKWWGDVKAVFKEHVVVY